MLAMKPMTTMRLRFIGKSGRGVATAPDPKGRKLVAGGEASVTSATTGQPRKRGCAPKGRKNRAVHELLLSPVVMRDATSRAPAGAHARMVRVPVVALVTLAPPPRRRRGIVAGRR